MPIKTPNNNNSKKQKNKRQNRPSEIRLSGVPPIIPIKTQNQQKNNVKYVYQEKNAK